MQLQSHHTTLAGVRPQDQWKRAFVICTHDLFLIVCVCMSVLIKPYRRGCLALNKGSSHTVGRVWGDGSHRL